jgi:protein-tyrosine phosphatase
MTVQPEWIDLEGAVNARAVVPGALLRSDNLQDLTAADVRRLLVEQQLEVVVDLRTDVEVLREGPGPLNAELAVRVEHHSLYPDSGGLTDLDVQTIRPQYLVPGGRFPDEPAIVQAYLSYLERRPDSVVAAVREVALAERAVLVHCAAGKDRTGVIVAMALDAAGADRAAIVDDYMATAGRIEAIVERLSQSDTYRDDMRRDAPHEHAPPPGTMDRVLEIVDLEFGGSRAWLTRHGLDGEALDRLSRRLQPVGESRAIS